MSLSVPVVIAILDLGAMNATVALVIAVIKALLVILYFMHMRYTSNLTWAFVGAGFLFPAILITFTLGDIPTRAWPYQSTELSGFFSLLLPL